MSIDLSTEVSAVGTVVLALFAVVTAIVAGLAFSKQSQEVHDQAGMLKIQSPRPVPGAPRLRDPPSAGSRQPSLLMQGSCIRGATLARTPLADRPSDQSCQPVNPFP